MEVRQDRIDTSGHGKGSKKKGKRDEEDARGPRSSSRACILKRVLQSMGQEGVSLG